MTIKSGVLSFLLTAGLSLGLMSCSSTDEQQEDVLQSEEQDQQDQQDQQEDQENVGEENFNSLNNEGLNNEDLNNEGLNNEGLNNEGLNNEGLNNELGNSEFQNEGELQQIIEEMNNSNTNQFAQQNAGLDNQQVAENGQLANDLGAGNQVANQGLEDMTQGMNAEMQPVAESGNSMQTETAMSTGTPLAPGLPELGSKMSYIVQKGDTLAKIATKIYGDPKRWVEIAEFTGIANPRLIYPGDVVYYQLTEQTQAFASGYESVSRSEVQVMAGDTLSTIAGRVLGSSSNWKAIWRLNDTVVHPDRLEVGSTLYYVEPGMLTAAVETAKQYFAKQAKKSVEAVKVVELESRETTVKVSNKDDNSSDFANVNSADFEIFI